MDVGKRQTNNRYIFEKDCHNLFPNQQCILNLDLFI